MASNVKANIDDHVEDFDKVHEEHELPYPEQLAGLSEEEIKKLGKKATLKLDLLIMPAMTIMCNKPVTASCMRTNC